MSQKMHERRNRFAGHCIRGETLVSKMVLWSPNHVNRKPGRPALTYIDILKKDSGLDLGSIKTEMQDRGVWKAIMIGNTTTLKQVSKLPTWNCIVRIRIFVQVIWNQFYKSPFPWFKIGGGGQKRKISTIHIFVLNSLQKNSISIKTKKYFVVEPFLQCSNISITCKFHTVKNL